MKTKLLLALAALTVPVMASASTGLGGPFVGAYVASVDGNDKGIEIAKSSGAPSGYTQETSPEGAAFGLLGGYNWMFNNLLVGVEADYETRSLDDSSPQKYLGAPDSNYPVKTELSAAYSLRAKLGYAFNAQRTMVYVTAGYAAADIKRTFTSIPSAKSLSDSGWQDSLATGLGVEHLINNNFSVRADYLVADYGDTTIDASSLYFDSIEKQSYDEQSFRIGVAYNF